MPPTKQTARRGRPFLPDELRRAYKIQVRCTADEYNRWSAQSDSAGVSMAEYLRRCEVACGSEVIQDACDA